MKKMVIYGASDDLVEFEGVVSAIDDTLDPSDYYADEFESAKNVMGPDDGAEFNVILNDDDVAVFYVGAYPGPELGYGITKALIIEARYDGRWSFMPAKIDSDNRYPDWKTTISQHEDVIYSTKVTIWLPREYAHVKRIL